MALKHMQNTSEKYQLNKVDLYKILRGAGITLAGAILTYVGSIYLNVDYSFTMDGKVIDLTPVAIAIIGALLEAGRRAITNFQQGE